MSAPTTTIILSPLSTLASDQSYYNVGQEYPQDPLHAMRRFLLYPWAYTVNPIVTWAQPPA